MAAFVGNDRREFPVIHLVPIAQKVANNAAVFRTSNNQIHGETDSLAEISSTESMSVKRESELPRVAMGDLFQILGQNVHFQVDRASRCLFLQGCMRIRMRDDCDANNQVFNGSHRQADSLDGN